MPSIDVVSRINFPELDNAINNTKKAIATRFDFKNAPVQIEVNQKEKTISWHTTDDGKMKAVREMFEQAAIKRGFDLRAFEWGEIEPARHGALGNVKRECKLKDGLTSENAKLITKWVKESKIKVQASIQGDEVRLTAKQIDDIRTVMASLQGGASGCPQPLQFVNPKS